MTGITIDSQSSRDLDDALWVESAGHGYTLSASISDVAAYVPKNSSTDQEALKRGFTRYHPQSNSPMLPRQLADHSLSLLPDKISDAVTVNLYFDREFRLLDFKPVVRFTRCANACKFSHEAFDLALGDSRARFHQQCKLLSNIAEELYRERCRRGSIVGALRESGFILTEDGKLERVEQTSMHAQLVVQECMILTNWVVAEIIRSSGYPCIARNHQPEHAILQQELIDQYQEALESKQGDPLALLRSKIANSFGGARYGVDFSGHQALGLPTYLHFTSPIRRYADLLNQRVLAAIVNGEPALYTREECAQISEALNQLSSEARAHRDRGFQDSFRNAVVRNGMRSSPASLDDHQFHAFLRAAIIDPQLQSQDLFDAIIARLNQGTLPEQTVRKIVFDLPVGQITLNDLREPLADWLVRYPVSASRIFLLQQQARDHFDPPTVHLERLSGGANRRTANSAVAEWQFNGQRFQSGIRVAFKAKQAAQLACLDLLLQHLGYSEEAIDRRLATIGQTKPDTFTVNMINPKATLLELAKSGEEWSRVTFDARPNTRNGNLSFVGYASIWHGQECLVGESPDHSKKQEAERAACVALLNELIRRRLISST